MGFQLNEDSLTPLYQQLMEDIKTSLAEGKYMPDEKIPSEPELSELYHVSRITVRRAIEELCTEGYLVKKQGKGTYVSQPEGDAQNSAERRCNGLFRGVPRLRHAAGARSSASSAALHARMKCAFSACSRIRM